MKRDLDHHTIKYLLKRIGLNRIILVASLLSSFIASAQDERNAFLISFEHKALEEDTSKLVSERALNRRKRLNIPFNSNDYPVNQAYINRVMQDSNLNFRYSLKWKNAIVVDTEQEKLEHLNDLDFVVNVQYVGKVNANSPYETAMVHPIFNYAKLTEISTKGLKLEEYGKSKDQISQVRIEQLHKRGFDGNGVYMAVFDAGFMNLNVLPSYTRLRAQRKLYSGYDVVDLDNTLTDTDNHGTAVSSCISAYEPNDYIGSAPNASVFLFRTENGKSEYLIEELNWCKAAELADSIGVDMVTSSLGYTNFDDPKMNHSYDDLDGKHTYVAEAAQQLIDRGVIVINSAGNEGDDKWGKIGTPSDVKDVLSIGAVDLSGNISGFSSRGINNGIIKPDLCALGVRSTVSSTYGSYYQGYGTSYATPIFSGGIACLIQAHPNKSPDEIRKALRQSGRNNQDPDTIYGYGVANFLAAHILLSDSLNKPKIIEISRGKEILFYNAGAEELEVKIKSKKKFLLIFNVLRTERVIHHQTTLPLYYLNLSELGLDCTKKYTVKAKLKSSVDNHRLRYKDLQLCTP